MRIRQIKPAFWSDSKLAELREPVRLFYIGTWMLADDAGWFRVDVPEIAKELYGFDGRKRREVNVDAYLDALVATNRIERFDCGHALVVHLRDHQHLAGSTKQVTTFAREHARCEPASPQTPADTRDDPPSPALVSKGEGQGRVGSVRQGQKGAQARTNEDDGRAFVTILPPPPGYRPPELRPFSKAEQVGKAKAR